MLVLRGGGRPEGLDRRRQEDEHGEHGGGTEVPQRRTSRSKEKSAKNGEDARRTLRKNRQRQRMNVGTGKGNRNRALVPGRHHFVGYWTLRVRGVR
jgi:hypothetical protein